MQKIDKNYWRRLAVAIIGLPVMSFGICLTVLGNMGSDPFTSFQMGINNLTNIPLGTCSLICNVAILVVFFFLRRDLVSITTLIYAFGVGPFINIWNNLIFNAIDMNSLSVAVRAGSVVLGTVVMILAISWYIPANVGMQPLDIFATSVGDIFKKSYGFGLNFIYIIMFIFALLMGSPWGFGTVVATLLVGKGVDFVVPIFAPIVKKLCGIKE